MTHVYRFFINADLQRTLQLQQAVQLRPMHDNGCEVIISYTAQSVQDNRSLETVARHLITQSIVGWLTGDAELIDGYVSLNVLRNHLISENLNELAEWVGSFSEVTMHNLNDREWTCVWIIFA